MIRWLLPLFLSATAWCQIQSPILRQIDLLTADPAHCGPGDTWYNATAGVLKVCTAVDTPTVVGGGGGATIAHTTAVLKGDNAGNGVAASAGTDFLAPFGSQTQKYFYAAPNAADGSPSFRAMLATDVPALSYVTAVTAANVGAALLVTDTGTTNAYAGCPAGSPALAVGMIVNLQPANTNTGDSTFAYCGGAARHIYTASAETLIANQIVSGVPGINSSVLLQYGGGFISGWQLVMDGIRNGQFGASLPNLSIGQGYLAEYYQAGTTGTTNGLIVKYQVSSGGVVTAATSDADTLGIAAATATFGGEVQVATLGYTYCVADNSVTLGHLIGVGTTTAGRCKDLGTTSQSAVPTTLQVLGDARFTCSVGNTCYVNLWGPGIYGTNTANLAGSGNAFACLDSNGNLYRSGTACL